MSNKYRDFDPEEMTVFEAEPSEDDFTITEDLSEEELDCIAAEAADAPFYIGEPPEEYISLPNDETVAISYIEKLVELCPSVARKTLRKMKIRESLKAWQEARDAFSPEDFAATLKRAKKCKNFDIDAYLEACEGYYPTEDDKSMIFWLMDHCDDEY